MINIDLLTEYASIHTKKAPQYLENIEEDTLKNVDYPQMLPGIVAGRLLKFLVQITNAKCVLDIGTFTGYSALSLAEGLVDGGRVITIEFKDEHFEIAEKNITASPLKDKIDLIRGPALDVIPTIAEEIDLAFIDADKMNYENYYEMVLKKIRVGGVIIIDNSLWWGKVTDPKDKTTRHIDQLNKKISEDNRVENVMLTISDGVNLIRKL